MTIASDKRIIKDLNDRNLKVVMFVCENEDKQVQLLSYSSEGLVEYLSEPTDAIKINEKLEGRMIRPICEINKSRIK